MKFVLGAHCLDFIFRLPGSSHLEIGDPGECYTPYCYCSHLSICIAPSIEPKYSHSVMFQGGAWS